MKKLINIQRLVRNAVFFLGIPFLGGISLFAAESETIDIHVSVNATKSLSVGTTAYDFGALAVNTSSVSANAIVVTNDSTGLIETYTMLAGNAISDTGGTDWTLNTSTGSDQYRLMAQFSNSRPSNSESTWTNDDLNSSVLVCTNEIFGNGSAAESGENVSPLLGQNTRNLWIRIITPDQVTDSSGHTATITLAVQ